MLSLVDLLAVWPGVRAVPDMPCCRLAVLHTLAAQPLHCDQFSDASDRNAFLRFLMLCNVSAAGQSACSQTEGQTSRTSTEACALVI